MRDIPPPTSTPRGEKWSLYAYRGVPGKRRNIPLFEMFGGLSMAVNMQLVLFVAIRYIVKGTNKSGQTRPPSLSWILDGWKMGQLPPIPGRPREPLFVGQQLYIERAYEILGLSQAQIASHVGIAIPRVRRYLIERGLYAPRSPTRSRAREALIASAVEAYIEGEKVVEICSTYNVNPAELYRMLKDLNIPLRMKARLS